MLGTRKQMYSIWKVQEAYFIKIEVGFSLSYRKNPYKDNTVADYNYSFDWLLYILLELILLLIKIRIPGHWSGNAGAYMGYTFQGFN